MRKRTLISFIFFKDFTIETITYQAHANKISGRKSAQDAVTVDVHHFTFLIGALLSTTGFISQSLSHTVYRGSVLQFARTLSRGQSRRPRWMKFRTWDFPLINCTLRSWTTRWTIANDRKLHAPRQPIGYYSGLDENSARSDPSAAASSSYIVRTEPFPAHSRDCYAPCPTITC